MNKQLQPLIAALEARLQRGEAVGVQLLVGRHDATLLELNLGATAPAPDGRAVDAGTQFCIGSCSKPFAATVVMSLVADGALELDAPIDKQLPAFAQPLIGSKDSPARPAERAPTVRELLCHRAGVYSQKERITPTQTALIRDFSRTLTQAVDAIAKEKLVAAPGERYAYSGAGYCVLGRAAEVAAGQPFEALLQARVCRPLGLTRTTYFPRAGEPNVAAGQPPEPAGGQRSPAAPHCFGADHKLTLVGGSLYSTAREMARFARAMIGQGQFEGERLLPLTAWRELTRRQYPRQRYGMGWGLGFRADGEQTVALSHSGALFTCRSHLDIRLDSGCYGVVNWTIAPPKRARAAARPAPMTPPPAALKSALDALSGQPTTPIPDGDEAALR